MTREDFIAALQACYFGDRNAFDEIVSVYEDLQQENKQLKDNWNELKKYTYKVIETDNELYGTWLLQEMKRLEEGVK